jgi:hypothetical protein
MQTVLKQIITKFNSEFDKQKFLDWFNNSKESWLVEEKEQIETAFIKGIECGVNNEYAFEDLHAKNYYSQTFKND